MTCVVYSNKGTPILIDDEDWSLCLMANWSEVLTPRGRLYFQASINGKQVYLHRLLLRAPPRVFVDHINGDTLDNRRSNLRLCSPRESARNVRVKSSSKTGLKGVQLRSDGKFVARIRDAAGQRQFLGAFTNPGDAHAAYVRAAHQHHGEFAHG